MARIPLDHPRTLTFRALEAVCKRRYGKMLDPALVMFHHRRVLWTLFRAEGGIARWNSLDPTIQALAVLAPSAAIGCSWCVDFGYWEFHHRSVDPAKLRNVPRWRESDVYTDRERQVLAYAEAMTATPPEVTDEMVDGLRTWLSDQQLVELTSLVAVENQRSRINAAMGLTSQGFKESCELRPA